ncbi:hypothetical protein D3C71_1953870 [compost metagenome]
MLAGLLTTKASTPREDISNLTAANLRKYSDLGKIGDALVIGMLNSFQILKSVTFRPQLMLAI